MLIIMIVFTHRRWENQCKKGVMSSMVRDGTSDKRCNDMFRRRVCTESSSLWFKVSDNVESQRWRKCGGTDKSDEHVKDDTRHFRAAQKRHEHAQRIHPQIDQGGHHDSEMRPATARRTAARHWRARNMLNQCWVTAATVHWQTASTGGQWVEPPR